MSRPSLAAAFVLVAALALAGCTGAQTRSQDGVERVTKAGTVAVADIRAGYCLKAAAARSAQTTSLQKVAAVPCDQAHDAEATEVAASTLTNYDASKLQQEAVSRCDAAFTSYVGLDPDDSYLRASGLVPSEDTWADPDARRIVCLAVDPSGDTLTQSVKGGGQVYANSAESFAASLSALQPGVCVSSNDLATATTTIPTTGCSKPHDVEVTARVTATVKDYDESALDTDALAQCFAAFVAYTGKQPDDTLSDDYIPPTEQSWAGGDRDIICLAVDLRGPTLTESVKATS